MDLRAAASYFSQDPVYDAYTGAYLFDCRTAPHDDQTSSGATSRRRTMTTRHDTTPPVRSVVRLYGEEWLVGTNNPDYFRGVAIRRNYDLKKSTGLMARLTPAQACLSELGTEFYARKEYYRDNQDARTSADWDTMWNIFCPPDEAVAKGDFLRQGSILYRVRNSYPTPEVLHVAEADQFDTDALQVLTFAGQTMNLVADQMTGSGPSVPGIQTDLPKFYQFRTAIEANQQKPGDRTVFVPKSLVTPRVGARFSMLGANWLVLAAVSEKDSWALHARLA